MHIVCEAWHKEDDFMIILGVVEEFSFALSAKDGDATWIMTLYDCPFDDDCSPPSKDHIVVDAMGEYEDFSEISETTAETVFRRVIPQLLSLARLRDGVEQTPVHKERLN